MHNVSASSYTQKINLKFHMKSYVDQAYPTCFIQFFDILLYISINCVCPILLPQNPIGDGYLN